MSFVPQMIDRQPLKKCAVFTAIEMRIIQPHKHWNYRQGQAAPLLTVIPF